MDKKDYCQSIRKCPVCFGQRAIKLTQMDYGISNGLPLSYDIVRCDSCSMIYNDFSASKEYFLNYYQQCGKYSDENQLGGGGLSAEEMIIWNHYFSVLQPFLQPDNAILDVGCGKGGLLQVIKNHGFNNLWAVEPSVQCIKNLRENDINAFGDWKELEGKKFDVIISSAVFEHLTDPREMMELFLQKLTDRGILMISVPDVKSYRKYTEAPFYFFDREHINHFSVDSLKLLCSIYSMEPEHLQIFTYPAGGAIKFRSDILGVFKRNIPESNGAIEEYISLCSQKKIHLPEEAAACKNIFLWGIGAYAETLLRSGIFTKCGNVFLLDKDVTKQGKVICGKTIHAPEYLQQFAPDESAVIITSVLYKDKIISALNDMHFTGKYFII